MRKTRKIIWKRHERRSQYQFSGAVCSRCGKTDPKTNKTYEILSYTPTGGRRVQKHLWCSIVCFLKSNPRHKIPPATEI